MFFILRDEEVRKIDDLAVQCGTRKTLVARPARRGCATRPRPAQLTGEFARLVVLFGVFNSFLSPSSLREFIGLPASIHAGVHDAENLVDSLREIRRQ
jgi:hypothetical protein